jgi:hypothetical protein
MSGNLNFENFSVEEINHKAGNFFRHQRELIKKHEAALQDPNSIHDAWYGRQLVFKVLSEKNPSTPIYFYIKQISSESPHNEQIVPIYPSTLDEDKKFSYTAPPGYQIFIFARTGDPVHDVSTSYGRITLLNDIDVIWQQY